MSDTRTDRDVLAAMMDPYALTPQKWPPLLFMEQERMGRVSEAYRSADAILAAGFTRRIPAPSSIAVPHTPEEIWAFADRECEAGFWDKDHLEYTPDGVLHLASNVNITADREYLPVELRPDIGGDW